MKVIAITGRSGSGKSTVSAYYGSLGYPVLDADRTAREVTRPGGPCLAQLCDAFGSDIFLPDGTLDYENLETLDLPLIKQCLHQLSETGKTELPIYDFATEQRAAAVEPIDLQGGVCIVEGIHALNPELTGLVPDDQIYRPSAWGLHGTADPEGADFRACANYGPLYGKY